MISIATKKGKYTFCQLPEILLISKSFISREQIMKKKLKWSFTDNVYFNADYNLPSYNTVCGYAQFAIIAHVLKKKKFCFFQS